MKEINKATVNSWLRDKQIVKVFSSSNFTSSEEKQLSKEVDAIRRRGNGVCVLLVEIK